MSARPEVACCVAWMMQRRPSGPSWVHGVNCPFTPTEKVLSPELEAARLEERKDCRWHVRAGLPYLTSGLCQGPECEDYFAHWADHDDDLREAFAS